MTNQERRPFQDPEYNEVVGESVSRFLLTQAAWDDALSGHEQEVFSINWRASSEAQRTIAPNSPIRKEARSDLFTILFAIKREEQKALQSIEKELKGLSAEPSYRDTLLARERAKKAVFVDLVDLTNDPTAAFRKRVQK